MLIPPLTPVTLVRQLGTNNRMKESGDVLEIEDGGKILTEKLIREVVARAQSTGFLPERWSPRLACTAQMRSVLGRQPPQRVELTEDTSSREDTKRNTLPDIPVPWSEGLGNCQHR